MNNSKYESVSSSDRFTQTLLKGFMVGFRPVRCNGTDECLKSESMVSYEIIGLNGIKVPNLSIEIGSVIINYAGNSSAADPILWRGQCHWTKLGSGMA